MKESYLPTKTRVVPLESSQQKSFFDFLSYHPEIREVSCAIPNGGFRNKKEAYNLKRQGVSAGMPDTFLAIPARDYHGLFIEFKRKGNKLTELQSKKFEKLRNKGYCCEVAYDWYEAREILKKYLGVERL